MMKKLIHAEECTEESLGFIPPEALEGDNPSFKSVVWSLGVFLHYMATFKLPYEESNKFAALEKMEKGERQPLPEGYSQEVRELLDALLQKEQSKRLTIDEVMHRPVV
jgi:serine/threonine protein kinase